MLTDDQIEDKIYELYNETMFNHGYDDEDFRPYKSVMMQEIVDLIFSPEWLTISPNEQVIKIEQIKYLHVGRYARDTVMNECELSCEQ